MSGLLIREIMEPQVAVEQVVMDIITHGQIVDQVEVQVLILILEMAQLP